MFVFKISGLNSLHTQHEIFTFNNHQLHLSNQIGVQIYILGAQFREELMMCAGEKAIVPSQTMTVNNALTAGKQ